MAYSDLTAEQQAQLDAWCNNVRALMGTFQRCVNEMVAYRDAYWVSGGVNDLLTTGDWTGANSAIPNKSGLAGAAVQDKDDFVSLVSQIEGVVVAATTFVSGFNTDALRQQRVAAAGPNNT